MKVKQKKAAIRRWDIKRDILLAANGQVNVSAEWLCRLIFEQSIKVFTPPALRTDQVVPKMTIEGKILVLDNLLNELIPFIGIRCAKLMVENSRIQFNLPDIKGLLDECDKYNSASVDTYLDKELLLKFSKLRRPNIDGLYFSGNDAETYVAVARHYMAVYGLTTTISSCIENHLSALLGEEVDGAELRRRVTVPEHEIPKCREQRDRFRDYGQQQWERLEQLMKLVHPRYLYGSDWQSRNGEETFSISQVDFEMLPPGIWTNGSGAGGQRSLIGDRIDISEAADELTGWYRQNGCSEAFETLGAFKQRNYRAYVMRGTSSNEDFIICDTVVRGNAVYIFRSKAGEASWRNEVQRSKLDILTAPDALCFLRRLNHSPKIRERILRLVSQL